MLMERLRTKSAVLRPLAEATKGLRQTILNKQHMMDGNDRASMAICLDDLQQHIPITSLEAMVERLEATAKQLGLKFTSSTSAVWEVYMSCDMFYVEVLLDRDGSTRDVMVEFAAESTNTENGELAQSCPELIDCLSRCDFKQFTAHLEGFLAMYTLTTDDKKAKLRTQYALKALETDLSKLFELAQETISDTYKLVLKSPVGLLIPRKGGSAMRLVYFVSPYELLDVAANSSVPLTAATAHNNTQFGQHVQLNIQSTTALHKLQLTTLMQVTKGPDAKKLPSFSGLTASNSITIPSVFTLKLPTPLPLSIALALRIADVTGINLHDVKGTEISEVSETCNSSSYCSLMELIVTQASQGLITGPPAADKALYVSLPDQQHCYYLTTHGFELPGVMVSSIPFSHPTHITSILMLLRAQAAFNTLIASCVRPNSKQDADSSYMFEVTSLSHEYISVTFEHPQDESTATAELDLSDLCSARCRLHIMSHNPNTAQLCSDDYATKVLQRCLSIPVTMRAVMKKISRDERKDALPQGDTVVMNNNRPSDPNHNSKFLLTDYERAGQVRRDQMMGQHHTNSGGNSVTAGHHNNAALSMQAARMKGAAAGGGINNIIGAGGSGSNLSNNSFFSNAAYAHIKSEPGVDVSYVTMPPQSTSSHKLGLQQQRKPHFLEDVKAVKVRKRKVIDVDHKGGGGHHHYSDDIIEVDDPLADPLDISDAKRRDILSSYDAIDSTRRRDRMDTSTDIKNRRENKMEKLQNFLAKRRASNDFSATTSSSSPATSSDAGSCDLAALREKVYGAGSAATFAQFNLVPSNDNITPDGRDITKKSKKPRSSDHHHHQQAVDTRKSPIVLDLTETDTSSKKSSSSSSSSNSARSSSGSSSINSSHSVQSLSAAALLKRPGIEIFPIPGSSAPISIPSSITVTPVIKSSSTSSLSYSSDDKYKDRKEKRDKKDSERRDKKRRRDESPSSSKSKVQIISSNLKHSSSLPSMDKFKSDSSSSRSSMSSVTVKANTPTYQSPSKTSRTPSSPSLSKSSLHSKLSYSPTHKTSSSSNKIIYSPSQSHHSSSSSPKLTSSPKHSGTSPKHASSGKPSMNTLKSSASSSSFSKPPNLSPKYSSSSSKNSSSTNSSSNTSTTTSTSGSNSSSTGSSSSSSSSHSYSNSKEKTSSSSGAMRTTQAVSGSSSSTSSSSQTSSKSKVSSSSSNLNSTNSSTTSSSSSSTTTTSNSSGSNSSSSSSEKTKTSSSDSLSITKVSGSGDSNSPLTHSFFSASNTPIASAFQDKSSFLIDKAKASPPKNRKGSCLSDIVDKLRAGVSGSSDTMCLVETNDKKDVTKVGGITDLKKDPDKKQSDYTMKNLDGLRISIKGTKTKELKENLKNSSNSNSLSPVPKSSKSSSGLKPGVISGPASKKVSMSNLPPIPKLSATSGVMNTTLSVSPLSTAQTSSSTATTSYNSILSSHSSSHYQKERNKDKSSGDRSSSSDRSKTKDSSSSKSGVLESRRENSSSASSSSSNIPDKHTSSGSTSTTSSNSSSSNSSSSSTISKSGRDDPRGSSSVSGSSSSGGSSSRKQSSNENESSKTSKLSHQRLSDNKPEVVSEPGHSSSSTSVGRSSNSDSSSSKTTSTVANPSASLSGQSQSSSSARGLSLDAGSSSLDSNKYNSKSVTDSSSSKESKVRNEILTTSASSTSTSKSHSSSSSNSNVKSSSLANDSRNVGDGNSKESHSNTNRKSEPPSSKSSDVNNTSISSSSVNSNSLHVVSKSACSGSSTSGSSINSNTTSSTTITSTKPTTSSQSSSVNKTFSSSSTKSSSTTSSNSQQSTTSGTSLKGQSSSASLPPPPPPPLPHYSHPPLSPSVSIKIVKSPAPVSSPLNMISPLSVSSQHSPCIIDDDLMDEALMGPRKWLSNLLCAL
uniref:Mediator of RNA polymerase II transcription subunit 1 n=3 Tax=Hirondellea gigas TaxID=1518452 RepID=A0A6A7G849_9CRUS